MRKGKRKEGKNRNQAKVKLRGEMQYGIINVNTF